MSKEAKAEIDRRQAGLDAARGGGMQIVATAGQLALIAERSPGYAVDIVMDDGSAAPASGIAFRRRESGRRDRAYVAMTLAGRPALFPAETELRIRD